MRSHFFFLSGLSSTNITIHRAAGEGGGYLFISSLPIPPTSQTFRHQPDNYCPELTSAHSKQPNWNREPLVYERKSLGTKLSNLIIKIVIIITVNIIENIKASRNHNQIIYNHNHNLQHENNSKEPETRFQQHLVFLIPFYVFYFQIKNNKGHGQKKMCPSQIFHI